VIGRSLFDTRKRQREEEQQSVNDENSVLGWICLLGQAIAEFDRRVGAFGCFHADDRAGVHRRMIWNRRRDFGLLSSSSDG
jgi:hypothetical protein